MNQRFLNKIIFINSAHTPYAEIKLDGNVHFIGTQGVGKSTLLRAILFFYNADKTKLGIAPEKQKFDEFYLPYDNSYIVYEVMRENGAYCVLAFKHKARIAFRFIDAPFDRTWLVRENGEVIPRNQIRNYIGSRIQISRLVTSYETFRDIIFGNNKSRDMMEFRKYAIVESSNYQNIPRTIQNVFLNSKLDADFIKDTIIRSMNEEEMSINLDVFRELTKSFEQNYNDVMLWLKKDKQGTSPVERSAKKVINDYRVLLYTDNSINEGRKELLYVEDTSKQELPILETKISELETENQRIKRLQGEEQDKYQKERDKILSDRAVVNENLSKCRNLRKEYDEINISEIVSRIEKEAIVEQLLSSAQRQKNELTSVFADISAKYNASLLNLENDRRTFELEQRDLVNQKESEKTTRLQNLYLLKSKEESELRAVYDDKLQAVNETLNKHYEDKNKAESSLRNLRFETPYTEQVSKISREIDGFSKRRNDLESDIKLYQKDIESLQNECELKITQVDTNDLEAAHKDYEKINNELQSIKQLLDNQNDSLAKWLETNKQGWEENIAKVLSEEVLYSSDLSPKLANGNSLYGVNIDLDELCCKVRLPRELQEEYKLINKRFEEAKAQLNLQNNEVEAKKDDINKTYKKRSKELNAKVSDSRIELDKLELKIKKANSEKLSLLKKEEEWKGAKIVEINNQLTENANSIRICNEELTNLKTELNKALNLIIKKHNDEVRKLDNEIKAVKDKCDKAIRDNKIEIEKSRNEILLAQDREFAGRGADIEEIRKFDEKIAAQKAELQYIKNNRNIVIKFQLDSQNYLDKEAEFKATKKTLEDNLASLESRYDNRKLKLINQKIKLEEQLSIAKKDYNDLSLSLNDLKAFYEEPTFCPPGSIPNSPKESNKSLSDLLKELKELIISRIRLHKAFKDSVGQFVSPFSINNTFNFNLNLKSDKEYFDFAAELDSFVLDNKIEEFQIRVNEQYSYILLRVAKEMENLTRNESEIHKTILEINEDFVRRNFAGVIRKIELRDQASNDKLMILLRDIKNFTDESEFQIGEINLFSQNNDKQELNRKAVDYLLQLMHSLQNEPARKEVLLTDTFRLEFRISENDNDTGWVEKISNVGSDGTDILVKAMVNIMLINVFKEKASKKFSDFRLHCMMDEIGKLHPNNVKGIIEFANSRNILLINSSPTTYSVKTYSYTYLLEKDKNANTIVRPLISMI